MIISSKEKKNNHEEEIKNDERREAFIQLIGSAKHPDFPMTKYDTYDQ